MSETELLNPSSTYSSMKSSGMGFVDMSAVYSKIIESSADAKKSYAELEDYQRQEQAKIQEVSNKYQKVAALLQSPNVHAGSRKNLQTKVAKLERDLKEMQEKFGENYMNMRKAKMKDVDDAVRSASKIICSEKNLCALFPLSPNVPIVYVNPEFDVTEELLTLAKKIYAERGKKTSSK